jgi:hypothetical protein
MPKETRQYVPKLMAYRQIVLDPQAYGIVLPELENHPYFVALDIDNDIDVAVVIKLAEIPEEEFHNLNPSFNKPVILSNANQQILLPFAHAEIFQANLKSYDKPLSSWTAVKISKTESVDQVAKTLGVEVDSLRAVNGIPKGMRVKAGSTVLIPKTSSRAGDVSLRRDGVHGSPQVNEERCFVFDNRTNIGWRHQLFNSERASFAIGKRMSFLNLGDKTCISSIGGVCVVHLPSFCHVSAVVLNHD